MRSIKIYNETVTNLMSLLFIPKKNLGMKLKILETINDKFKTIILISAKVICQSINITKTARSKFSNFNRKILRKSLQILFNQMKNNKKIFSILTI